MDHVTRRGQRIERLDRKIVHIVDALAVSMRIALSQNHVQAFTTKPPERDFEITEVLFGPLDFYADENKSVVCREWHTTRS